MYSQFLIALPASSKVFLVPADSLALKSVYFKLTDKLFCQELKLFNENYNHLLILLIVSFLFQPINFPSGSSSLSLQPQLQHLSQAP